METQPTPSRPRHASAFRRFTPLILNPTADTQELEPCYSLADAFAAAHDVIRKVSSYSTHYYPAVYDRGTGDRIFTRVPTSVGPAGYWGDGSFSENHPDIERMEAGRVLAYR